MKNDVPKKKLFNQCNELQQLSSRKLVIANLNFPTDTIVTKDSQTKISSSSERNDHPWIKHAASVETKKNLT